MTPLTFIAPEELFTRRELILTPVQKDKLNISGRFSPLRLMAGSLNNLNFCS